MSHSTYNRQWAEAQSAIADLIQVEMPEEPPKPEKDRLAAFQLLATMYIKYIQIFRRLEESYDQIVHPQKRRVLRHVLDGVIGRILELKNEMINLEFSEYHYMDDVLSDLKLTPNDLEMPIPRYFLRERKEALQKTEKMLGQILAKMGPQEREEKAEVKMSMEEAIRLIQIHERARQGRLRAKFMREIRLQEERDRNASQKGAPTMDSEVAAIKIQKMWKGFITRRKTQKRREEELMFIGMTPPPPAANPKNTPQALALKTEEKRHTVQEKNEQEYQQALVLIKDKIKETEGPDIKETMQDQIRQWFIECRDATGKFPEYPDEDEGGSALIFKEKDPAEIEAELKAKEEEKGGKGGKGKKGKKDKKEKKGKKDKKGKKGKKGKGGDDDEEEEGWKMAPSNFVPAVHEGQETYKGVWQTRDEADNFSQKHDAELIKEDKRKEVEAEIRVSVDELMRQELKNLKAAVDRDKGKKKGKKSGKKKKKKKKSGKKGKKGKKEKDLTPDRTIEELYEELVMQGIIVRVPKVQLKEYEGEYSYLGTTLRQANIEPMPSLSDVRRVVTEFAILPLGSQAVHEKAPLVKSVLLAGPRGTGKRMLVNSICAETGANLFDLTPQNLVGKYPGKDGLKMLMHLLFKVGRAMQPSVFYIGECEKMLKKKIPKTDPTDPKRLKKELPKAMKNVKAEDRLLLVGTSRAPFEAEIKPFCTLYQRIILIPRPDYASRNLIWRSQIVKAGGIVGNNLDISSLAKITDGYTPGHMVTACQQVLTDRRISQLQKKPLQAVEFIAPLARIDPIYKEEEEAFKTWYAKTPLGKKRAKAAQGDDEDAGGKGGKGKKGKKGGKKGKKKKK
ncbi:IQ and AAA domain-containing protein 1 isoform X1 [Lingula anatina]|uniref:IQ and AAA domain-containing protein 1 isoform X1 n=1 Tax=Lingula anatina TaxID=7574 RepID=A0A1S3K3Z2_LINAN|nr:IQ and AAA domain-containing protein 1 isoform X1 [Lingula anatina]|eukprot:XP_013416976.1 IQ and AAA domain-containing protein 1 isoform X1 [Lingula anatina]